MLAKLFALIMMAGFIASCASVTDANMTELDGDEVPAIIQEVDPETVWGENGDDMDPIIAPPPEDPPPPPPPCPEYPNCW